MALRNPLGSFTALSVAADPATLITAVTVAGVAVTIGAATYTYHAYKDYVEKKHREEIEYVIRLYRKHLERINIPDYHEIQGFPPIFKLDKDKDTSTVESMHLTDDQIHDIGKNLPHSTDIILSMYRESILNAILKLKDYYFSRKERNDITAGVISYLLYMLQTKCLNFEGYDYDIAYLNAISNFITAFASTKDREKTQEFSRLNPVFAYLTTAKQVLEKHKESLSIEEMIGELRDNCTHKSNQLIRCFTRIITKNKHWPLIENVAIDELAQGMLRREYIHGEVKGLIYSKDNRKDLPDSSFKNWLVDLSNYYIKSLDPDTKISRKEITAPRLNYTLPPLERLKELNNKQEKPSKAEKEELLKIENDLKLLKETFEACPNFITTTLDLKSKNALPKMISITDQEELITRSKTIVNFATLIHQVISLQYLCMHLLKSTKQLGELYVKNPNHFCRIFFVLDSLCQNIKDSITKNKKDLTNIQRSDLNTMQLESQEILPDQIKELLESTYATISRLGAQVKDYRIRVAKHLNPSEPTLKSVKMEMLEAANTLSDIYEIGVNNKSKSEHKKTEKNTHKQHLTEASIEKTNMHKSADGKSENKEKEKNKDKDKIKDKEKRKSLPQKLLPLPLAMLANEATHLIKPEKKSQEVISNSPQDKIVADTAAETTINDNKTMPLSIVEDHQIEQPAKVIRPAETVDSVTTYITKMIVDKKNQCLQQNNEQVVLDLVVQSISQLHEKANTLATEQNKTPSRQNKADNIAKLSLRLLEKIRDYLQLSPSERKKNAKDFMSDISNELDNQNNNAFIDDHYNDASKFFYSLGQLGLFRTDSRKRFVSFKEACEVMTNYYLAEKTASLNNEI